MKVNIIQIVDHTLDAVIDLPIDKWEDIKEWFIKWDVFHYTLDGDNWVDLPLASASNTDIRLPIAVRVYETETYDLLHDSDDE